ncbi:MAG TPA: ribbon-helix-helix domain-containing protein [Thermoanaerobaculia bacterium]|nr:ribbon-helix-helix domain-containing protein [Thermoanaerobaculia bacterium]
MVVPNEDRPRARAGGSAKISVSLPAADLERVDRECREAGESRSELFRRALQALFDGKSRDAAARRYVEGYVAEPETEYEVAAAGSLAPAAFDEEEWE